MDALMAIALICQVSGSDVHHVIKHQESCQKELIRCYQENHPTSYKWEGPLKDCVLKKISKDLTDCTQ